MRAGRARVQEMRPSPRRVGMAQQVVSAWRTLQHCFQLVVRDGAGSIFVEFVEGDPAALNLLIREGLL